jgi:hypothetical protein
MKAGEPMKNLWTVSGRAAGTVSIHSAMLENPVFAPI